MGSWTLWKWCFLGAGALAAVYGLHRLALRLEQAGHLYYLHKKTSGGGALGSFVALQRVLEPRAEHVLIVHEEKTRRGQEGSGAPPLLSHFQGADDVFSAGADESLITLGEGARFVPAPADLDEPAHVRELDDVPFYASDDVAEAILAIPGMRLVDGAEHAWTAWKARWEADEQFIEIRLSASFRGTGVAGDVAPWEDSPILACCTPSQLLTVWKTVRARCPGVWLADSNDRLWSPRSFAERFRG
jgi:hypothetical protein